MNGPGPSRLHWRCGRTIGAGWINVGPLAPLRWRPRLRYPRRAPLESDSVDYAVSIHALQENPYDGLGTVLGELRRVLKPGGVLRLGLPDLLKGVDAYHRGDEDYFAVPDEDARDIDSKRRADPTPRSRHSTIESGKACSSRRTSRAPTGT